MGIVVKGQGREPDLVADGVYKARLTGIWEFQNTHGDRLGFEFTLEGGETVMQSTAPKLTLKSKLAELLRGLMGRELEPGELSGGFDLENLVGTDCQVLVQQGRGKGGNVYSNVEQVFR